MRHTLLSLASAAPLSLLACSPDVLVGGFTAPHGSTTSGSASSASGAGGAIGSSSTATVTATSGAGGGVASGAGGGAVASSFELVGVRKATDGTLIADSIDPATGNGSTLWPLGTLGTPDDHPEVLFDPDGIHIYAATTQWLTFDPTLLSLDLTTGKATSVSTQQPTTDPQGNFRLAGVTTDHHVVGVFWGGTKNIVDLIDPATGAVTAVGDLGALATWPRNLSYDPAARRLYGADGEHTLYVLDLDTQHVSTVTFPVTGYFYDFAIPNAAGELLATSNAANLSTFWVLDPVTGSRTAKGTATIGSVSVWGGVTYDASVDRMYTVQFQPDPIQPNELYSLDLATGRSAAIPLAHEYSLARR